MITLRVIWLVAGLMLARVAWAQGDVSTLEHALDGNRMLLRNYSADPVAGYEWVGGTLVAGPVGTHTLAVFTTRSVKLKQGKVVFEGDRQTLVLDATTNQPALVGHAPMKLEVDLHHANPGMVLPHLKEMLFFPDEQAAIAGLPVWVAEQLPIAGKATCYRVQLEYNCPGSYLRDGHWNRLEAHDPRFSPPRIVSFGAPQQPGPLARGSIEPSFAAFWPSIPSGTGPLNVASDGPTMGYWVPMYQPPPKHPDVGTLIILTFISESGAVDLWLALPRVSSGDPDPGKSLRSRSFSPALYDGRPVGFIQTNISSAPLH